MFWNLFDPLFWERSGTFSDSASSLLLPAGLGNVGIKCKLPQTDFSLSCSEVQPNGKLTHLKLQSVWVFALNLEKDNKKISVKTSLI